MIVIISITIKSSQRAQYIKHVLCIDILSKGCTNKIILRAYSKNKLYEFRKVSRVKKFS